jgi:hypothetical protein
VAEGEVIESDVENLASLMDKDMLFGIR